jgi:hypothetical protein
VAEPTQTLYADVQGGRLACFDHLGCYGQDAVTAWPQDTQWITPLNIWEVFPETEKAEWRAIGLSPVCETCP